MWAEKAMNNHSKAISVKNESWFLIHRMKISHKTEEALHPSNIISQ